MLIVHLIRKPLSEGNVAANVLRWGAGALNIDVCRIPTGENRSRPPRTPNTIYGGGHGTSLTASQSHPDGRWPANLILSGGTSPVPPDAIQGLEMQEPGVSRFFKIVGS